MDLSKVVPRATGAAVTAAADFSKGGADAGANEGQAETVHSDTAEEESVEDEVLRVHMKARADADALHVDAASVPPSRFSTFYYSDEVVGGMQGASSRYTFKARRVPASSMARAWGFGTTAMSVAVGALTGGGVWNASSAESLASGLSRLRGAATKLGQMLSLQDESFLPEPAAQALERVRTHADMMPRSQLDKCLSGEIGEGFSDKFGGEWRAQSDGTFVGFDYSPVAAASIGQVHRACLPGGRRIAVKVRKSFPGIQKEARFKADEDEGIRIVCVGLRACRFSIPGLRRAWILTLRICAIC
jgi:hypothetical protein